MNLRELRDKLFCDHFESHWCGDEGGLYAIPPGELVGACSRCLVSRIEHLRHKQTELPSWVSVLEQEAKRELAHQAREQSAEFALRFDDFLKCWRCGKLIHEGEARYPAQAKKDSGGISPHCIDCASAISRL